MVKWYRNLSYFFSPSWSSVLNLLTDLVPSIRLAIGAAVGVGAVVYFSLLLLVSGDFRALVTSILPVELPSP